MTMLEKLTFSDKLRTAVLVSPEARLRRKILDALGLQIDAATAKSNGEVYVRRAKRWVSPSTIIRATVLGN